MQINERGDIVISSDNNIMQIIQEYIQTMEEGWLEKTLLLFRDIKSLNSMQSIIAQFEDINKSWKSPEIMDFITQLHSIYWEKSNRNVIV